MNTKWNELETSIQSQACLTTNNPVILALKSGYITPAQGIEVLKQYFYLVTTIVQFLTIAMVRIPEQPAKKELRRNLNEELGSRTGGVPHQELLETLFRQELGIEVRTTWNDATQCFITNLFLAFNTCSPRFVAGMIYALEATACPELRVVGSIINLAAQKEIINLFMLSFKGFANTVEREGPTCLQNFLALHTLDFEVGHESGLRTTLEEFASADWEEFQDGSYLVLSLMQVWWNQLARLARS